MASRDFLSLWRMVAAAAFLAMSVPVAATDQPSNEAASQDTAICEPAPQSVSPRYAALWDAQPALIDKCLALVPQRAANHPNIYTVAIAPLGTQNLFSREARLALLRLAANYGGTAGRGILLSNAADDLGKVPLATQENIALVMSAIGQRTQVSPDDVLIVYLSSHGSPDASLGSALPGNSPILAISADSMAAALDGAHIKRRVIIISACFAASWISKLANDDTIIVAAAAADRTSFGCDDRRELTYFGDAFLNGPLSRGASLADAFEGAKKTVTQWETEQKLLNSLPQVFIGTNMQAFWQATVPGTPPSAAKPMRIARTTNTSPAKAATKRP